MGKYGRHAPYRVISYPTLTLFLSALGVRTLPCVYARGYTGLTGPYFIRVSVGSIIGLDLPNEYSCEYSCPSHEFAGRSPAQVRVPLADLAPWFTHVYTDWSLPHDRSMGPPRFMALLLSSCSHIGSVYFCNSSADLRNRNEKWTGEGKF